jgi:hypothetical protein
MVRQRRGGDVHRRLRDAQPGPQGQGMAETPPNAQFHRPPNLPGGPRPALWGGVALAGPGPSGGANQAAEAGAERPS